MYRCNELNLDGKKRLSSQVRATYSTTQKMRASMTYAFGRIHGLGSMHWQRGSDGHMVGNPSVSEVVSRYMLSLHRRKVKAGETATSARAISAATMYTLYHFNARVPVRDLRHPPAKGSKADCDQWAGQNTRRLLQLAFMLAFSCLLCVDEVLKIQSHDFINLGNNWLQLTLPFRKTNQFGHIKPFVLHKLPKPMAHLCPVRAYAKWIKALRIKKGYMFQQPADGACALPRKSGCPSRTAECFLEMFRNNLIDIGVDPVAYSTHSFRRGGCQWLASDLRWPLRWICEWGGWSTEFTHLTIVKYLISWNDDPSQNREDFFDLNRAPALKCFACGRSCRCS
ncbi:DNA breaking-rejoining enzyme [Lactarius hatsudake]|nr:DNA breaking-rejoining enzyme [Lactarius hatsudake]